MSFGYRRYPMSISSISRYYPLDERTGTSAADATGAGSALTILSGTGNLAAVRGPGRQPQQCLDFTRAAAPATRPASWHPAARDPRSDVGTTPVSPNTAATLTTLYLDGVAVDSLSSYSGSLGTATGLMIGGRLDGAGNYFLGPLGHVQIYSAALSAFDVNYLYRGGLAPRLRARAA